MFSPDELTALDLAGVAFSAEVQADGTLKAVGGMWQKLGEQTLELARRGLLRLVVVADEQEGIPNDYLGDEAAPLRVIKARDVANAISQLPKLSTFDRLRSFVKTLSAVPENIWEKIAVAEQTFLIGGYKESPPNHPEVIESLLTEIEQLCHEGRILLPQSWRQSYWVKGLIPVLALQTKGAVMKFLQNADEELLDVLQALPRGNHTRIYLLHRFCAASLIERYQDTDHLELLIHKCQNAGLLSDGAPGGPPGTLNYFRSMRHRTTPLVDALTRLLGMSEIMPEKE